MLHKFKLYCLNWEITRHSNGVWLCEKRTSHGVVVDNHFAPIFCVMKIIPPLFHYRNFGNCLFKTVWVYLKLSFPKKVISLDIKHILLICKKHLKAYLIQLYYNNFTILVTHNFSPPLCRTCLYVFFKTAASSCFTMVFDCLIDPRPGSGLNGKILS